MKQDIYIPQRGDLVWLNFNPQAGHEQAGRRPAFVISNMNYNQVTGLMICCPITSKVKNYPFEVLLPDSLKVEGVILSDQIKNLDWKIRDVKYISKAPKSVTKDVLLKLGTLITIDF